MLLRRLLIRLSVVISLSHLLLLKIVYLWVIRVHHRVRGLSLVLNRVLLKMVWVLHPSIVECVNSCICSRLHTPCHGGDSLRVLLYTFTLSSDFSCVYLIRRVFKSVNILVDKASTLCRVLPLFFFNVRTRAIVR